MESTQQYKWFRGITSGLRTVLMRFPVPPHTCELAAVGSGPSGWPQGWPYACLFICDVATCDKGMKGRH